MESSVDRMGTHAQPDQRKNEEGTGKGEEGRGKREEGRESRVTQGACSSSTTFRTDC